MALEDVIKELTTAIIANTAALGKSNGATGGGATKSTGSTGTGKTTGKATGKASGPTIDQVAKRYGAYMAAEGDDGKAQVRKVVKHFGVKKVSDLEAEQFDEALAMLDQLEAGDDPFSSGEDEDDLM